MRTFTRWWSFLSLAVLCAALASAAQAGPQVSLSRTYVSFGDLCIGGTAGPLCFTITNTGNANLVINSTNVINCSSSIDPTYIDCTTVAGFVISSGGGAGTLTPGQSRTVCVTFTPHEAATFSAFVAINTNATPATSTVELHGTGDLCTTPQVSLSRTYMSFGDLCIGGTAGPLCFTITNTGNANLVINSVGIVNCSSSIDPTYIDCSTVAGFAISSGGAPGTLTPGQSRTVCVTFTPHEAATFSGFVQISTNASPGTSTVELHGTGDLCPASPPQVTLGRTYMSFGDLCIGKTAGPLCFTITNTGGSNLVINSINIVNCSSSIDPTYIDCTTVAGFVISSGGGAGTLAPGASRTVCVTFTPHEAATFSAFVLINTNASPGTSTVELHGTGDRCVTSRDLLGLPSLG